MPYTLQTRLIQLEERFKIIEQRVATTDLDMDKLTDRVDAIAQSMERIEKSINSFIQFLRTFLQWVGLAIGTIATSVVAYYITTHFIR